MQTIIKLNHETQIKANVTDSFVHATQAGMCCLHKLLCMMLFQESRALFI